MPRSYLVVLGHREAIGWVLREQRMAFPATPRPEVAALDSGDELFLYATRGAWLNPTRDRGRVIAIAHAVSKVRRLDEPVEIAGRSFVSGCDLRVDGLAPYPNGLELQPLVERLAAFPKPQAWSIYLRRALLRLPEPDAAILRGGLAPQLTTHAAALGSYPWATGGAHVACG